MAIKYELETIPVWDAYRAGSECPLCLLLRRAEAEFVRFYVGHSVMVPEMRVQVNDAGFCRVHFPMLLDGGNRLGLALITHTHLGELRGKLERHLPAGKSGGALKKELARLAALVEEQLDRCLICDRLHDRLLRYAYTIVHLWRTDADFHAEFLASKGFCLDHLKGTLAMARDTLPGARLAAFVADTAEVQGRAWDRLEGRAARLHRQVRLPCDRPHRCRDQALGGGRHRQADRRRPRPARRGRGERSGGPGVVGRLGPERRRER